MIEIPESVETWEETEKTIGETLPVIYGADAATLGWIRQWNEVIEADCPLYYDEELAQRLGYKTIPAPAGMAMAVAEALDVIGFHEIVGCVAGDNTIMCAVRTVDDTILLMDKLKKLISAR